MNNEGPRADFANKNPEGETGPAAVTLAPGDKSSRESASKRHERTAECSGDTLTAGDEKPSQKLASVSCASVTADVTESPEGGAEPDRPVEQPPSHMPTRAPAAVSQHQAFPSFMRRYIDMAGASGPEMDQPRPLPKADFVPRILREAKAVTSPVTHASGAHLEPIGQNEPEDDRKIPNFLRRHGVGAAHAQPIARDRESSEGPQADQPSGFVPSIMLRDRPVTTSQASPVGASVTPVVTAGSVCPTCHCRVPARASAAERQKAYRERKREQRNPVVP